MNLNTVFRFFTVSYSQSPAIHHHHYHHHEKIYCTPCASNAPLPQIISTTNCFFPFRTVFVVYDLDWTYCSSASIFLLSITRFLDTCGRLRWPHSQLLAHTKHFIITNHSISISYHHYFFYIFPRRADNGNVVLRCAVSVKGRLDVNVALNRPSYQVSEYYDGHAGVTYYAKYGNDGIRETNCHAATCPHSNVETNPWWAVDLGVALHVWGIIFTNRGDMGGKPTLHVCCFLPCQPYGTRHFLIIPYHFSKQTNLICAIAVIDSVVSYVIFCVRRH